MLKLLRIRSWIGLMAVFVVGAGIFGMPDRLEGWWASGPSWWSAAQEERDWRQQELAFLKGIYDRLERQRQAEGGNAPASLRREQEAILKRMAETAKPIRDKVPPEIRALLPDSADAEPARPVTQAEPVTATAAPAAAVPAESISVPKAPPPLPEVHIELGSLPRMDVGLSASSRYIEIDRPIEQIVRVREPRPGKSSETKAREANAPEAKSDETKAETKTAESKPAKPKAAKPKPAAAAPETGGGAKE